MSEDTLSDSPRLPLATSAPERIRSDGRKMSATDIDEQIEAGFRQAFEDGSSPTLELSQGDNRRVPRRRKTPRRPLNGTPPTTPELE
jgi:hypothetical protein